MATGECQYANDTDDRPSVAVLDDGLNIGPHLDDGADDTKKSDNGRNP